MIAADLQCLGQPPKSVGLQGLRGQVYRWHHAMLTANPRGGRHETTTTTTHSTRMIMLMSATHFAEMFLSASVNTEQAVMG